MSQLRASGPAVVAHHARIALAWHSGATQRTKGAAARVATTHEGAPDGAVRAGDHRGGKVSSLYPMRAQNWRLGERGGNARATELGSPA